LKRKNIRRLIPPNNYKGGINMPKCPLCNGAGIYYYSLLGKYVTCNRCNGKGTVPEVRRPCPICNGRGDTGKLPSGGWNTRFERCRYCNGTGIIIETD